MDTVIDAVELCGATLLLALMYVMSCTIAASEQMQRRREDRDEIDSAVLASAVH